MKRSILKKIYFQNAEDGNLEEFTVKSLSSGLLWIYIALNPKKPWDVVFKKLSRKNN